MSKVITLDDLQAYMVGVEVDPGLGQLVVDGVNSYIDTNTGRCFGDTKQVTEQYDYASTTWLRHPDVVSIDEIRTGLPGQASTLLAPSNYYFSPLGRVRLAGGDVSGRVSDYASIQYTYGTEDVPDDLKFAALGVAAGFYTYASEGSKDVASVSIDNYKIEYAGKFPSTGESNKTTTDINWAVIASYKMRRV